MFRFTLIRLYLKNTAQNTEKTPKTLQKNIEPIFAQFLVILFITKF